MFKVLLIFPCFVTAQQYITLFTGEKPGAVSSVSGHHVTLPSGTQDDTELPQHRERATHNERGDKTTVTSLRLHRLSSSLLFTTVLQIYFFYALDCFCVTSLQIMYQINMCLFLFFFRFCASYVQAIME